MTDITNDENDVDEDIDDVVSWGIIGGEDKWENGDFQLGINEKYPGWYLIKIPHYSSVLFTEIKEWLKDDNVSFGSYETVGWGGECSYSVGVIFESAKDAMIFKLRWR